MNGVGGHAWYIMKSLGFDVELLGENVSPEKVSKTLTRIERSSFVADLSHLLLTRTYFDFKNSRKKHHSVTSHP